jgi:DNA modification methylase
VTGQALIVQGDALRLPLPDASVDLIVTSPPFWNLRDYGVAGQIGNEATRREFLEHLWAATRECMRVMKPTASLFVELGDSYANRATPERVGSSDGLLGRGDRPGRLPRGDTPEKSLNLTPQRYVIGCVDDLGLTLRAEIIWSRPNGLPESVRDRVRLAHSRWWHLVKQPRYYSATDEVREPHAWTPTPGYQGHVAERVVEGQPTHRFQSPLQNPLGKLPGSVWSVPSEPLRLPDYLGVQHYAAFPSEWPRRLILGWSPPGICLECGQGRVPVVDTQRPDEQTDRIRKLAASQVERATMDGGTRSTTMGVPAAEISRTILGYTCLCAPDQPPTRPAVVLDPFSGTGTTAMVARALGRIGVGFDLSHDYCRAACWRVRHDGAKAVARTNLERQGSLL